MVSCNESTEPGLKIFSFSTPSSVDEKDLKEKHHMQLNVGEINIASATHWKHVLGYHEAVTEKGMFLTQFITGTCTLTHACGSRAL